MRHDQEGFSLVDVAIASVILAIALMTLAGTLASGWKMVRSNREEAIASQAARQMLERLNDRESTPFADLYATYNGLASDDPAGTGTAPGVGFDVPRLQPRDGDSDGLVGVVLFPESAPGVLREDLAGRDLNADGAVDTANHATDYQLLPVTVRIEWVGRRGESFHELHGMLAER